MFMLPRTRPKTLPLLTGGLLTAVLLTGCGGTEDTRQAEDAPATTATVDEGAPPQGETAPPEGEALLAAHGLEGKDARTLIDELDATPVGERSTAFMASIRADTLVVTDGSTETSLDLPDDEFYVSIAPFVDQTHDCFFHSLTTCRGELANEDIAVEIVDDSGTVLIDEAMTTFDNGFVGLWLPRDVSGTITLELDGRTVTDRISTGAEDPTCVTTLQLT